MTKPMKAADRAPDRREVLSRLHDMKKRVAVISVLGFGFLVALVSGHAYGVTQTAQAKGTSVTATTSWSQATSQFFGPSNGGGFGFGTPAPSVPQTPVARTRLS